MNSPIAVSAAAVDVGELAVERRDHGRSEQIRDDDPGEIVKIAEVAADRGQRARHDGLVHRRQEAAQHQAVEDPVDLRLGQRRRHRGGRYRRGTHRLGVWGGRCGHRPGKDRAPLAGWQWGRKRVSHEPGSARRRAAPPRPPSRRDHILGARKTMQLERISVRLNLCPTHPRGKRQPRLCPSTGAPSKAGLCIRTNERCAPAVRPASQLDGGLGR
jgi:hypothetical protein